jgi:hypothetical protein
VGADTAVVRVPLLGEGADPDRSSAIHDHLLVDGRLLDGHERRALFAYEVTPEAMKHLRGVAAPGDLIVFRAGGPLVPDRICAVRTGHGIVLARVLFKDPSLLLLPGEGQTEFEAVDLPDATAVQSAIAGTHLLLIRR